ncbi:hypothetical protein HK104_004727 [Borealophlyctis nickersoniae]|nr:hypothetical protein HK104_004727 [Borealophlyctis nickersoniae]
MYTISDMITNLPNDRMIALEHQFLHHIAEFNDGNLAFDYHVLCLQKLVALGRTELGKLLALQYSQIPAARDDDIQKVLRSVREANEQASQVLQRMAEEECSDVDWDHELDFIDLPSTTPAPAPAKPTEPATAKPAIEPIVNPTPLVSTPAEPATAKPAIEPIVNPTPLVSKPEKPVNAPLVNSEPSKPVNAPLVLKPVKPPKPTKPSKTAAPARKAKTYKTPRIVEDSDTETAPARKAKTYKTPRIVEDSDTETAPATPAATAPIEPAAKKTRSNKSFDSIMDSVATLGTSWNKNSHGRNLHKIQEGIRELLTWDLTLRIDEWWEVKLNGSQIFTWEDPIQEFKKSLVVDRTCNKLEKGGPETNRQTRCHAYEKPLHACFRNARVGADATWFGTCYLGVKHLAFKSASRLKCRFRANDVSDSPDSLRGEPGDDGIQSRADQEAGVLDWGQDWSESVRSIDLYNWGKFKEEGHKRKAQTDGSESQAKKQKK